MSAEQAPLKNAAAAYQPAPGTFARLGVFRAPLVQTEFLGGSYLYFGDDHLLHLSPQFEELTAHRFSYAEIRGVHLQPDSRASSASAIWAMVLLAAAVFYASALLPETRFLGIYFGTLLATVGLVGLLCNLVLGPTCKVTLYTRTAAEPLTALRRRRYAEKALAILRQRVEAAQGALPTDLSEVAPDSFRATDRPVPALALRRRFSGLAPDSSGNIHLIFFALLLSMALLLCLDFFFFSPVKHVVDAVLLMVAIGVGCLAVARQRSSTLSEGLKRFTLAALFMQAGFVYLTEIVEVARNMDSMMVSGAMPAAAVPMNASDPAEVFARAFQLFKITWCGFLGFFGLVLTLQYRLRRTAMTKAWAKRSTLQEPIPQDDPDGSAP